MATIGKIITAVLVITFLIALGGDATGAGNFGTNAAKAGGVVLTTGIAAIKTGAAVLAGSTAKPKTTAPGPTQSTAPAAGTPAHA